MAMTPDQMRRLLDATGFPYEIVACDPNLSDTAVFCEHYGYALEDSANTIVMKAKSGDRPHVACVVLGDCRLDANHTLRKRLNARKVSFAAAEETRAITGMELGGVTPFGLPPELALWVDAAVMARPTIVLGGGERASKIVIAPDALLTLSQAEVVEGLAKRVERD